MRILYVTAGMPYGPSETFIVSEIAELQRRNEVLVVPRSPGNLGQHAPWLAPYTKRENLLSWTVLQAMLAGCAKQPRQAASSLRLLFCSRNMKTFLRNLAVFPKGVWLANVAAEWQADHIHCHWAGTTATMTMIASHLSRIPWSFTAHRSDIVSANLLREKAQSATTARAIAQEGRAMMIARGVADSDRLRVLPMGVPIPAAVAVAAAESPVVLCPADLLPVKGHRYLIEAWKLIRDRGVKATLWLAGSGELDALLKEQVRQLGLDDAVVFCGSLPHEELLALYKTHKITATVLSSIDLGNGCHEGIPVALVEAMSYGVPVIATSTGGIPELIQPGTGLLVPPQEPQALADSLQIVIENGALAETIGRAGRNWVAQTRDIVHTVGQLENLFREGSTEKLMAKPAAAGAMKVSLAPRSDLQRTAATISPEAQAPLR